MPCKCRLFYFYFSAVKESRVLYVGVLLQKMFDVGPSSGRVFVSGPLNWDYVAIAYFKVEANNTQASYQVHKTDTSMFT